MKKITKVITSVILAGILSVSAAGCSSKEVSSDNTADTVKTIRIGGPGAADANLMMELMNVAKAEGFLEEELKNAGYELDFRYLAGAGPAVNEALAAKELDVVVYGDLPGFVAKSNGIDTTLIASLNSELQYGIVTVNDDIKDPKDLEGKNVIVAEGSAIQYFWEQYAAAKDIDLSKVNMINATMETTSLLSTGQADAVVYTMYGAEQLVFAGLGKLFDTGAGHEDAHSAYIAVGRTDYLKENEEAAVAINKAFIRAYDAVLNDPTLVYKDSATESMPYEMWEAVYAYDPSFTYMNPQITAEEREYFNKFNSWLTDKQLISQPLDLDSFINTDYYDKASK